MSACTAAPAASLARQTAVPRPSSPSIATSPQLLPQRPTAGGSRAAAVPAPKPLAARLPCRHAAARVMAATVPAQVVLTREQGKNDALRKVLESRGISCLELPMVETAAGPDQARLPQVLAERHQEFDWVCITSPEAASVFLTGWRAAGRPPVRVAVVGEGTARVFQTPAAVAEGVPEPQFVPTVANAEHFGPELPVIEGGTMRILYPSSNKASTVLQQSGLTERGFEVLRLNTYDTLPVSQLDEGQLAAAKQAAVVTIGSPSAIKAWVQIVGEEATRGMSIACIGSTSARAAEKLGLQAIKYAEEPGVDTWAAVVQECLQERQLLPAA
ncbi:hypothetical protein D9Q98_007177 [Chlorella vulgaris]|uniref:Uroporphyrinogen-III synthase n=1 Tax=Chlorella vulgaris TaxID=3077 RepID=A0A9D4TJM5_CHLVU|nr:hypothetical protein D9Q98_007177 [Chlorella vulgaris]